MFVNRIIADNWTGTESGEVQRRCANVDEVILAVKSLNGQNRTSVYLFGDGRQSLTISGGNSGRYLAFVTIGVDDEFF
jgi:hypothetical protein